MSRDMARVLGGLGVVLLFAGLAAYDAGAQEKFIGKWKVEGGGIFEIEKDRSDPTKFIGKLKQRDQAVQIFKDPDVSVIGGAPMFCKKPPCNPSNPAYLLNRLAD